MIAPAITRPLAIDLFSGLFGWSEGLIAEGWHAMVACPRGFEEELRSGTWATIRYARKVGRRQLYVIYPDGKVEI